ncbi:MAG: Zn-ribbon domain-containing OB-fold protein [Lautropia sp.]
MSGLYTTFPAPLVTALTRPFWDGCAEGKLRLQRCDRCGRLRFYPTEACPDCRSTDATWTDVSGRARVFSWIVVHRSVDPVWQARAPFVTGIVEIDEQPGCLLPGLIVGADPQQVRIGMPVQVEFERTDPSTVVPRWRAA